MKIFSKIILFGVVFLNTTPFNLFGQSYYDRTNSHLKERIDYYTNILFETDNGNNPLTYISGDYKLNQDTLNALIDKQVSYEKHAIRNRWGLNVSGGYTYNSTYAPIDEEFFAYKNKAQATLSWDLKDSPIIGVRPKIETVELEGDIEKLSAQKNQNEIIYEKIILKIDDKYDIINQSLLLLRRDILNDMLRTYETMYQHSDANLETLYEINHEKQSIDNFISQLQLSESFDTVDIKAENFDLLKFYRVSDSLMTDLALKNNTENNISKKEIEILTNKIKQSTYLKDIGLSPFVRYQYLTYTDSYSNRNNLQAGINLTLPISGHYKSEQRAIRQKQYIAENKIGYNKENILLEAETLLKQHKKLAQSMQSILYKMLGYRILSYNNSYTSEVKPNTVNGLNTIKTIDKYVTQLIEFFTVRENYEKQLAAIQLFLNGASWGEFCSEELFSVNSNVKSATTGAYVWTRQHSVEPAKYVAEQLWSNNISTAYIGYSSEKKEEHYNSLISEISKYGIKSELCITSIKLSLEEEPQILDYLDKLLVIDGFSGIQLDIEPHQKSDWDNNKEFYLEHLLNMVKTTRDWCVKHNKTLSIALPYTYPESFYANIYPYVDRIIVMMYNKKVDTIIEKLSEHTFFGDKSNKYEIAIRPEDFIGNRDDDYRILLTLEQTKGISIESLSTLSAVKKLSPKIKKDTTNRYSLILDNTVTNLSTESIKTKIGSLNYKIFSVKDLQGNIIIEVSNIPSETEAIRFFGTLIRDK